jgi:ubiquinone/menaquinone biosynthesis C-methylase UbiE
MKDQALYKDLAKYYDLIYSSKNYEAEAGRINELVKKHKRSSGKDLLEVACGTGKHAQYLKKRFRVLATDVNAGMLGIARRNVKGVTFKQADMTTLNLNKKFDVIVCLFSSIGYVKTHANLRKTINGFAKHLKRGGVVLIEPWFTKGKYMVGSPHMTIYDGKDIKIARLSVSKVRGIVAVLDMSYLIAERDKGVKHFADRHELAMFDIQKMKEIMEQNGLRTKFVASGRNNNRGLLVGTMR